MPETVVTVTPVEGKPESTTDSLFSWININYGYFRTVPGMLKIAQALIGVICLALATPAILSGTSWFLFVVVLSFVATLVWIAIYLIGVREALTLPINWILTELLNTCLVTVLYAVAFIVQLSVWSTPYASRYRSSNIAAGILQNLGKVDRTSDDIFEEHLQNFTRQQNAANRLQKEFNNYIRCIRAAQVASKQLMDSLNEIYESQWTGHDLLYVQAQNIEMLWQDFSHKLGDQVLIPLNTYQAQFPEMRKKIDKRGRKLVDYDSQRHHSQSLQGGGTMKKRDEIKVAKAREQLEEAKRTYEQLNSELHDELPALHDSRVLFLVTNLQTLFAAEQVFHSETAKVYSELEAIVDKLATDSQRGSYTLKKIANSPKAINSNSTSLPGSPTSNTEEEDSPTFPDPRPVSPSSPITNGGSPSPPPVVNGNIAPDTATDSDIVEPPTTTADTDATETNNNKQEVEQLYDIPPGATTENLPPGVLYRVKATYKYNREDSDELSFEVGEIIRVIEYDDPDEQEEGWLMGMKENSNEKGMFPANFTRPL